MVAAFVSANTGRHILPLLAPIQKSMLRSERENMSVL